MPLGWIPSGAAHDTQSPLGLSPLGHSHNPHDPSGRNTSGEAQARIILVWYHREKRIFTIKENYLWH